MNSFEKLVAIVRLVLVEFLLMLFWFTLPSNLLKDIQENTVASDLWFLITVFVLGALCMFWLIRTMIRPRLQAGVGYTQPLVRYSFKGFCSTHPTYIFIDAALLLWAYAFTEFSTHTVYEDLRTTTGYAIALFIIVLRLFMWFVMRYKFTKEQCTNAWKPVMWFWIIVAPFLIAIFVLG
ncbi:MAG: hypothetical protein WCQ95_05805 [Bacteroidota bacterium]